MLDNNTAKSVHSQLMNTILNNLVKQALRQTKYRQIGKRPQFFDVDNETHLAEAGIRMWSGFKVTSGLTETGITMGIDSVFKFLTTKTVLERIRELKKASAN